LTCRRRPRGQPNLLAEYVLHNISDSDFTLTGPAITDVEAVLRAIAGLWIRSCEPGLQHQVSQPGVQQSDR
jgi:hypothetical protein